MSLVICFTALVNDHVAHLFSVSRQATYSLRLQGAIGLKWEETSDNTSGIAQILQENNVFCRYVPHKCLSQITYGSRSTLCSAHIFL